MRSITCSRRSRASGLTLVEVVAAIAILGTVLVGVVLAKSRHTRQLATAERLMAAVRAADELISAWWADSEGVPVGQHGVTGPDGLLQWQAQEVDNTEIKRLGARVVRVELRDLRPSRTPTAAGEVLVAVELVLPDPEAVNARQDTASAEGPP